ncbi:MAG TPA: gamma-glutamyltransferase, partial [Phormidium sp.]
MYLFGKRVTSVTLTAVFSFSGVIVPTFINVPTAKVSYANAANRPTTMSMNGMVTAPHYLASQAALDVLRQGGNAVDASIAAASTLAVVYPHMNSIGGDNFWLIYNAKTGELKALNASGRSGEKATINFYQAQGYQKIPSRGYFAANTVPGAVSGWGEAYKYAQQSMGNSLPWNRLLDSAISYAENGFPVTPSQEHWTKINIDEKDKEFRNLQSFQGFKQTYLKS